MADNPKGAILQRDKETYAIVPRTPVGLITPAELESIATIARQYEIPIIKITSGQRIALVGLKEKDIDDIWKELAMAVGRATEPCVHYVQTCPGTTVCRFGVQDSLGMGMELEDLYVGMELSAKLKMGVSGCHFCCAESFVRDIGLIGKKKGWTVTFGGNSGGRPRIGDVLAEDLSKEEVMELVKRCLEYYRDNAKKKERTPRFIERIGVDTFKKAVL